MAFKHFEFIERHVGMLAILTGVAVSFAGLAEVAPLFIQANSVEVPEGVKPFNPLSLAGRDVYVREGCYLCHSQQIRTLDFETQRYGDYSLAEESAYDRPFQWGSKRTGPDLARVGGKYSDKWQREHLIDPRAVVPESNMPRYFYLDEKGVDAKDIQNRMRALRAIGDPYTDEDIESAPKAVKDKTELDALVAYLQGLGVDNVPKERPDPRDVP